MPYADEARYGTAGEFCSLKAAIAFVFECIGSVPKGLQQLAISSSMALEWRCSRRRIRHRTHLTRVSAQLLMARLSTTKIGPKPASMINASTFPRNSRNSHPFIRGLPLARHRRSICRWSPYFFKWYLFVDQTAGPATLVIGRRGARIAKKLRAPPLA